MRRGFLCMLLSIGIGGAADAQGYAKGVVPSDNLTRADAALGWFGFDAGDESLTALLLAYEHRLTENWAVGAFLTPLAYLDDEDSGSGDFGMGDLGVRGRFIEAEGDLHLGASLTMAGSSGALSAIGKNRFRVVPAALVVRPWSEEDFTALEAAWLEWVDRGDYAALSLAQGHLFPNGWFVVGEVSYRTGGSDDGIAIGVEAGKQLDERWQVALRPGYGFDGPDVPSIQLRAAYFF
jgi:hypothetical protein